MKIAEYFSWVIKRLFFLRYFLAASMVLAIFGVLDALLWQLQGQTLFAQLFSLLELFWLALSLVLLAIGWQHRWRVLPLGVFVVYQLALWGTGLLLHDAQAAEFVPPNGMLLASLLFYGCYFWLCRQYYSMEK